LFLHQDAVSKQLVPRALRELQPASAPDIDPLLLWRDERVVIVELYRPCDACAADNSADHFCYCGCHNGNDRYFVDVEQSSNGCVVTFSPVLSAALACNTNVEPLGTLEIRATSDVLVAFLFMTIRPFPRQYGASKIRCVLLGQIFDKGRL
jgi:hypothetical protein